MNTPPHARELHRVLMTTDTVGGVWTYTLDLCRGLAGYGIQVVLLSMGRMPDDRQMQDATALANVTLVPTAYRLEWMPDCEADLAHSGDLLMALEQEFRPEIVHLNTYWHAGLAFRAPRIVVAHSCVPSWWAACRGTPLPEQWHSYSEWVRRAVAMADVLVSPSAAYLRDFQRLHGMPKRWRLIRNGRDPSLYRSGPKRNLVLSAGRVWDEAKNIAAVCEAAADLAIPIMVAGDDTGPNGEAASCTNAGFLGRLPPERLAEWMATASVFVSPARYEPFGLCVLEAAFSSCALVLGDIPTFRELWDGAAVFVDPRDIAGLQRVLQHLYDRPGRAAELGANACARAAHYSLAKMVRSYHQTYQTLLSGELEAVA